MENAPARPVWVLWLLAAAMAGAASALYGRELAGRGVLAHDPVSLPWYALAVAFALAEIHVLHLHFRGETHSFSLNEILLVLGLFFVAPAGLVAAQLVGSGVVLALVRRQAALKLAFNLSHFALEVVVAILVFRALYDPAAPLGPRGWLAALAAAAVAATIALVAISAAVTVVEGRMSLSGVLRTFVFGLAGTAVNTMLGLVAVIVTWESPLAACLLVGPVALVFVAYRAYLSQRSKGEGLQFLYDASQRLNRAHDLEDGLVALLDFARETFHAELAEIVVLGSDDETIAYRTSAGPRVETSRMTAVPLAAVEPVLAAVTSTAAVLDSKTRTPRPRHDKLEIASAMLAPLTSDSGLRGAVLVANGDDSVRTFGKEELRLFETFANHLSTTLEKSQLSTSLAELRVLKQELAYQAFHDSLTGLANRTLFRERVDTALEQAARTGTGTAVLFVDLDDFKTVNDTMGHAAGDALLEVVGKRIAACIGPDDTAARLGGDEFAVLLVDVTHDADVRVVADRILVALGDPIDIEDQPVVTQASIGIATHVGAHDATELMQNADVAMYTAKRNGKGRFDVFEPTMSLSVAHRHQLKVGLERALACGELVVHYQPVVDVSTGEITATEALLRWKDPRRGLIGADEFIGVAEETGLIMPIGRFVLHEACRQTAKWCRVAPDLRVFVNLSARQLPDADLLADVCAALSDSGLAPERLLLEVTETAMMQDIEGARETLLALKDLGIGIGVDDFGTGFSSLSYLRRLPIDVLKIAKPFVDALDETAEDAAFVRSIVMLGHVVGLQVVAEGVERVEQLAHLVDMGCDLAQGYYYAASLEPSGVDALLGRDGAQRASTSRPPASVASPTP